MVTTLLNGTCHSSHSFSQILSTLLNRTIATVFRKNDQTAPESGYYYTPGQSSQEHEHAHPALIAWACELVAELVHRESDIMISRKAGLHVRAKNTSKKKATSSSTATPPLGLKNTAPLEEGVVPNEVDVELGAIGEDQSRSSNTGRVEGEGREDGVDDSADIEMALADNEPESSEEEGMDHDECEDERRGDRPAMQEVQEEAREDVVRDEAARGRAEGPSMADRRTEAPMSDDHITWQKIMDFSHGKMQKTARKHAPIMWMLINHYTSVPRLTKDDAGGRVVAQRVYRPNELVCLVAPSKI